MRELQCAIPVKCVNIARLGELQCAIPAKSVNIARLRELQCAIPAKSVNIARLRELQCAILLLGNSALFVEIRYSSSANTLVSLLFA
ncbi:hypothetical protein ASD40_10355 [Paenibacillus sp. Root444D2]|nr:hypothetical protein ASD40_10355 [Paenibacillus sp. Root444D2]